MKKSLFIIPLLSLAAVSCNNTEDLIFEGSAAERLEQSKVNAKAKLTEDGGLWAMEYFANDSEPGYVMLFRFDKNGSVEVSANHKWIGNTFKQERSLWDVISDNGTVLTFNSYNNLFHVFSDPNDITGPYQPVNPDLDNRPIDESGFGHEGDYEFQIMNDGDENTIRLLGKKYLDNIYLRKLPSDTDEAEYLAKVKANESLIYSGFFPTLIIHNNETGEEFVSSAKDGVMSVYPKDGDAITQTRSANYITTIDGIRFAKPFKVLHADGTECELDQFYFTEMGGLGNRQYTFRLPIDNYEELFFDKSLVWAIDLEENICPALKNAYAELKTQHDKYFKNRGGNKLTGLIFDYDNQEKQSRIKLVRSGDGMDVALYRVPKLDENGAYGFNISLTEGTDNGVLCVKSVKGTKELIDLLNSHSYAVSYRSELAPDVVTLTAVDDPTFLFNMNIQ